MSPISRRLGRLSGWLTAARAGTILAIAMLPAGTGAALAATAGKPSATLSGKGLVMCEGVYALCDAAPCVPIPEQAHVGGAPAAKPKKALCECVVESGPNLGPGPCKNRQPVGANGQYILSTYSFALPDDFLMSCPGGGQRTVCFGYPCVIDAKDPKHAQCTCPILYNTKPFETQGGHCDPATCTTTLWQGGTPNDYKLLNAIFAKATGQTPPGSCTTGTKP